MLLIRAFVVAAAVPALARLGLLRLEAVLEPRRPCATPAPRAVEDVGAAVERALALGRRVLRPTCLTRGITLYYLLRRAGVPVTLVFGLARSGDRTGHCWLVKDGQPFLEQRDPRGLYVETYRLPREAAA